MHSEINTILIFITSGILTGILSGVLGIGGGLIIVPVLLFIFKDVGIVDPLLAVRFAAATSLAIMILTAVAAVMTHKRENPNLLQLYKQLRFGITIGTIIGVLLAHEIPTHWLRIMLGLFLLLIATEMCIHFNLAKRNGFPKPWVNKLVSMVIGIKSGLLGIGGGALIIPYLTYCGVKRTETVGVSSMCTLTIATIGTTVFILVGITAGHHTPYSTGYIYWPAVFFVGVPSMIFAPFGARLTYILPVHYLKWAFFIVLVVTAFNLLIM